MTNFARLGIAFIYFLFTSFEPYPLSNKTIGNGTALAAGERK